jgi:hypothetical protein
MVVITINGKKSPREFQNMAMALGFAVNSGECRNAERLGLAYAGVKEAGGGGGSPGSGVVKEAGGGGKK